jgi:DNA-binding beta-propeller fold protein YncE
MHKPCKALVVGCVSLAFAAGITLAIASPAYAMRQYNAVSQFSKSSNPTGEWSYVADGKLLTTSAPKGFCGPTALGGWTNGGTPPHQAAIAGNLTASALSCTANNTVTVSPESLNLDPEGLSSVAAVWTAKTAGIYTVAGQFTGDDSFQQSHSVRILQNTTGIYANTISSYAQVQTFSQSVTVAAGDTISFTVYTGTSGPDNLSTGLKATITESSAPSVGSPKYVLYVSNSDYGGSCPADRSITRAEFPPLPPAENTLVPDGCADSLGNADIAFSSDGATAYVSEFTQGQITPIDTSKFTAGKSFPSGGTEPIFVAVTPDDRYLVVANSSSDSVGVISTQDPTQIKTVHDGHGPLDLGILSNGSAAFVANTDGTVSSISLNGTPSLTRTISFPSPGCSGGSKISIATAPDSRHVYVACQNNELWSVNVPENTVTKPPIPVPNAGQLVVTPDGTTAFVTGGGSGGGGVSKVDLATGVVTTIPLPDAYGLSMSPDGEYVATAQDQDGVSTVDLISTSSGRVVNTFQSGGSLIAWLAFLPALPESPYLSPIATTLSSPAQAFSSIGRTLEDAAIAAGAVLLITFPAQMFNATLDENYEEILAIWRGILWRVRGKKGSPQKSPVRSEKETDRKREIAIFAAVILAGAFIGGFRDPHFGFNGASVANFLATLAAFLVLIAAPAAAAMAYRKARGRPTNVTLHALPAGIAIAALTVFVSRVTDFQPGYLYGIVCGIAFAHRLAKSEEGHVVTFESTATLVISLLAWLIFVPVNHAALRPGSNFGIALVDDWLASIVVGGLVGIAIGLLPLRFLPGGTLFHWSRVAWAVLIGIPIFGIVGIMLNPSSGPAHPGAAPVVTAIVLFVVFGGVSIAFRQYFAHRHPSGDTGSRVTAPTGVERLR